MLEQDVVLKILTLTAFIILLETKTAWCGAGECRRLIGARTLMCYDCDSRNDSYCLHIDRSNLNAPKPRIKACQGCCVKFYHKFPQSDGYVIRSCTEHIIINYFMVDHVCMSEGKGRGKMCFCEDNLCNSASYFYSNLQLILLILPILFNYLNNYNYFT